MGLWVWDVNSGASIAHLISSLMPVEAMSSPHRLKLNKGLQ